MSYPFRLLSAEDRQVIEEIEHAKLFLADKTSLNEKALSLAIKNWVNDRYIIEGDNICITKDQGMRQIKTDIEFGYGMFEMAWDTYFHLNAMPHTILSISAHLPPFGDLYGVTRESIEEGIRDATKDGHIALLPQRQTSKFWCKVIPDDFTEWKMEKRHHSLNKSHLNNNMTHILFGCNPTRATYDSLIEFRNLYRQLEYQKEYTG